MPAPLSGKAVGLALVLCIGACTFLDDLDRSIEQKAEQLTSSVTKPAADNGDPLNAPEPPSTPSTPPPPPPEPVAPEPEPPAPKSAFDSTLPPGQLTIGTLDIHGALSVKEVSRTMERHRNELRFCYEASLTDSPLTKLSLKFVVSPAGAVQVATIEQSNSGNERLDMCVAQAIRRWSFPAPKGGGIAVITAPLELSRRAEKKP